MNHFPLLIFCLNKRRCTDIAKRVFQNKIFTNRGNEIEEFIFNNLLNTDPLILECEQLAFCVDLLKRGIAIHHSGLIPIIKEVTEMLIINKFIKIVIATETYAMGINAPMRSVLFLSLYKPESRSTKEISIKDIQKDIETSLNIKRRLLFSNEFIQMSGRAGRRNLDTKGYIYIYEENLPGPNLLKQMISGNSKNLISKFHLSNLMVLNVVRSNVLSLFSNSFKEEGFKNLEVESLILIKEKEAEFNKLNQFICDNEIMNKQEDQWIQLLVELKRIKETYNLLIKKEEVELWEILKGFSCALKKVQMGEYEITNDLLEFLYSKTSASPIKELIQEYLNKSNTNYTTQTVECCLNIPVLLKRVLLIIKGGLRIPKEEEFLKIERLLTLKEEINSLEKEIRYLKTQYLMEFDKRQGILQSQGFLEIENTKQTIQLKGHIALELRTLPETFFVNILMDSVFMGLDMKEFLCAVSCLMRTTGEHLHIKYSDLIEYFSSPDFTPKGESELSLRQNVDVTSLKTSLNINDSFDSLNIKDSELIKIEACLLKIEEYRNREMQVYERENINEEIPYDPYIPLFLYTWISGIPLNTFTKLFNIQEGGVSKLILRVDEMIKELFKCFEVSGIKNFDSFKNENFDILLRKKEIVFESLYLSAPVF